MKLNNNLLLSALIMGATWGLAVTACAQDTTNTAPATTGSASPATAVTAHPRASMGNLAQRLDLTEDQKVKAQPIFQDMMTQMATVRKDTTLDRPSKMLKNRQIAQATTAKLQEILTPDQLAKWQTMVSTRRAPLQPRTRGTNNVPNPQAPLVPPQQ